MIAGAVIDVGFYQLGQRRAETVLPPLVGKAIEAGHRILVRTRDAALLARLDTALWSHAADSFIPHGIDTDLGARAALQPVLLTTDAPASTNAADCLVQVGDDLPETLGDFRRVLFLFDADQVETARDRWRVLAKQGDVRPVYWREGEGGRFEKAG